VNIRRFWQGRNVKPPQRHAVIDPLIDSGDVFVPIRSSGSNFWDGLEGWWNLAFYRPPTHLVLSDRTWTRMVHEGVSGRSIVANTYIERTDEVNTGDEYKIDTGGGDNIGSPMGRKVRVDSIHFEGGHHQAADVSTDILRELVAALRADALKLSDAEDRTEVRALADKLEDESNADEPDEDKIEGMVGRAERLANGAAGLMTASHKVFEAYQQWRGQ